MWKCCSELAGSDWRLIVTGTPDGGVTLTTDRIQVVLLWEIREELKKLNALLHCQNFTEIPGTLKTISRKIPTRQPRKKSA
jgi:hypothetical protein